MTGQWIRFGAAALLIGFGVFIMAAGVFGVYRFKYVLNRMHVAAMGDTLGILCVIAGLIIICGFSFVSLKLLLVVVCFWLASPVSSHMISKLEVETNEELSRRCQFINKPEDEAKPVGEEKKG